jgi:D-3-phosphoglycerate dehydrogenase
MTLPTSDQKVVTPRTAEKVLTGLVLDSLQEDLDVEEEVARQLSARLERWDGTREALAHADFVLHVRTHIDSDLIGSLIRCRAIGRYGSGLDTVDMVAAGRRGIEVVGVPDYATQEVAQHALALGLAVARGAGLRNVISLSDGWDFLRAAPKIGLDGPIGIVGFGRIGQAVSRLWRVLGFEVLVASRRTEQIAQHGYRQVALDRLYSDCELISLHCALVPETQHMIGRAELGLMRADGILVNTARGSLIDSAALADALKTRQIRGAGLDVFEDNVASGWHVFAGQGLNVVLTPHIAWYSPGSLARLKRDAVSRTIEAARAQRD